jgi:hypothetical protein
LSGPLVANVATVMAAPGLSAADATATYRRTSASAVWK